MSKSECSKCKSPQWKSAKMVMLEGVSGSEGSMAGENRKDILASRIEGFFPTSDRWFDLETYTTRSSLKIETVSALAKAVEAAIAEEGASLKFPDEPEEPTEPKKPSKPWRSRPKEMTFYPPKPLSRVEMWVHRRTGWVVALLVAFIFFILNLLDREFTTAESFWAGLLVVYIEPLVTFWTTPFGFGATLAFAASFSVFWLSGFVGLEKYNRKKFEEAESNFAKRKADYEPKRIGAVKRYEEYDAQMADWKTKQDQHPGLHEQWVEQHRDWKAEVAEITDQRLALWDELRVCMRCGHVYRGPDPSKSLNLGPDTAASKPPKTGRGESASVSDLPDTAADALKKVADQASSTASEAAKKIKGLFNQDA